MIEIELSIFSELSLFFGKVSVEACVGEGDDFLVAMLRITRYPLDNLLANFCFAAACSTCITGLREV